MNKQLTKLLTIPTLIAVIMTATAFGFRPIFHPPTVSILDALRNDQENFSILIGLIRESGLDELTKEGKSFTLLAPTNAAFEKLPSGTLDSFKKDKKKVRELLFNHLLSGKILVSGQSSGKILASGQASGKDVGEAKGVSDPCIIPTRTLTNLALTSVKIECNGMTPNGRTFAEEGFIASINGSIRVLESDFEGDSAVIQVIDTVLLPEYKSASIGVDSGLPVRNETANGLNTTTFDTLVGTVTVNLPDDLAAGDTISGTVIAEVMKPAGVSKNQSPEQQASNLDELRGYVVEIAQPETPATKGKTNGLGLYKYDDPGKQGSNLIDFCKDPAKEQNNNSMSVCGKWSIPDGVAKIPIVLKNKEGKIVGRSEVPVGPKGSIAKVETPSGISQYPPKYFTPAVGQAGKPLSVNGPFNGDFASTSVKIGNQSAKFLASSPRKVVVESPRDLKGVSEIEVEYKGKTVAKCAYRSISIRLAADKLNLIKGEQTTLTVTLAGLIGLQSPVSVQLTNRSPGTVSMEGGETQTINVDPAAVNGDTFSTKRTLNGVKAGGFSINAIVDPASAGKGICSGGNNGNIPVVPAPAPSPGTPNGGQGGIPPVDADGNPRTNDGPSQPVNPLRARFRVTLNGFTVNHWTNHGLFQRPDAVTFHPHLGRVMADGTSPSAITSGDTNTIGMTPENPVRGGTSSANGGFQTGDGFPTQSAPWRRTLPRSPAPLTIPPTVYFEGEIVQNAEAIWIAPNVWSIDGQRNLDLVGAAANSLRRDLPALRTAVGRIIRGPQPLALTSYLRPGSSMGLGNTMSIGTGFMQDRPIGMQALGGGRFGFTPQVLVLTYDSADYFSRNSFGFATGVVPVHYVDASEFGADYTLYFQVERIDTEAPCAGSLNSTFTGNAEMRVTEPHVTEPIHSDVTLTVGFTDCRETIRITEFPTITHTFPTDLGNDTATVTMTEGGTGRFTLATGSIEIPVTLGFRNSLGVFGNSTLPLTLTGTVDARTRAVTLRGTGTFTGGALGTYQGSIVVTGTFAPGPR